MFNHDEFHQVKSRAKARREDCPTAVATRYDRRIGRVVFGLYFPKLDADLYLPALRQGFLMAPVRNLSPSPR